jgi:hypothetical protein
MEERSDLRHSSLPPLSPLFCLSLSLCLHDPRNTIRHGEIYARKFWLLLKYSPCECYSFKGFLSYLNKLFSFSLCVRSSNPSHFLVSKIIFPLLSLVDHLPPSVSLGGTSFLVVMSPVRAPVFFPGEEILSDVQVAIGDPWSNKGSSKGSVQYPTRRLTFSVDTMSWKKNMYPDLSVNFLAPVIRTNLEFVCFVITQKMWSNLIGYLT